MTFGYGEVSLVFDVRKPRYSEIMAGASRYSPARLEVRANQDLILQALNEGYAVKSIWRQLSEHELISVSYESFRLQVKAMLVRGGSAHGKSDNRDDDEDLDDQERMDRFMNQFR